MSTLVEKGELMAKKRSLQNKVALLQSHFNGEKKEEDPIESGEWSPENIAKNRQKYLEREAPWVLKNMSISDYYDQYIKPQQMAKAA
jgi:hypothetical protein